MDQQIQQYFEQYVTQCIDSPAFAHLAGDQKEKQKEEIRDYLNAAIINLMLDLMDNEQLERLSGVNPASPEGLALIEEIASEIPHFSDHVNDILQEETEKIISAGAIPAETATQSE